MAINKINSKSIEDLQISADDLANGTVTNAKLANTTITINGTSIDLGSSGDIVASTDWQAVVVADGSTSTTAVAGEGYFIDTTSNTHTVTLPSSPSIGDTVAIKDYAGTFSTNNLTIGRNGNNIQGVAIDSLISTNKASIILVYVDATKGWLYTVESNVSDLRSAVYITATGGTIITSGDFKTHVFTGDGCFVVSCAGNPIGSTSVDYLVVAGGGGGGGTSSGGCGGRGGGGAGGFRVSNSYSLPSPTMSPLSNPTGITAAVQTYPITVGGGGTPGPASTAPCGNGGQGSSSIFSTITSAGGGGGASYPVSSTQPFMNGGSGGGNYGVDPAGAGNTPPVSPPQGNPAVSLSPQPTGGSGGGGGGAGASNSSSVPESGAGGDGGIGSNISDSFIGPTAPSYGTPGPVGSTRYFSGGGGGGRYVPQSSTNGDGGAGGGGTGSGGSPAGSGTTNTGGAGGGTGTGPATGGAGGKGIVILRYKYQ